MHCAQCNIMYYCYCCCCCINAICAKPFGRMCLFSILNVLSSWNTSFATGFWHSILQIVFPLFEWKNLNAFLTRLHNNPMNLGMNAVQLLHLMRFTKRLHVFKKQNPNEQPMLRMVVFTYSATVKLKLTKQKGEIQGTELQIKQIFTNAVLCTLYM